MDAAAAIRDARTKAGLTQAGLAARAGTAQTAISAYESGRKAPSLETLDRVLAAAGSRLAVVPRERPVRTPSAAENARTSEILMEVIALAETLPTRHEKELRFPKLRSREAEG